MAMIDVEVDEELYPGEEIDPLEGNEDRFDWEEEESTTEIDVEPTSHETTVDKVDKRRNADLSPEEVLERYWGYKSFRPLQRDILMSVLEGHDTLALLPTGGGKSICFQVPGLMRRGITLVITPLISLMKDQVDHLRARGIKAASIHSGMTGAKIRQTLDNCQYGRYKFLYISPERLNSERFIQHLAELEIGLLVIDECHCICQWGYDFRPSYLSVLTLREYVPNVPIIALTATATPEVVVDVRRVLGMGAEAKFFQKTFHRDNLSYSIRHTSDKQEMLLYILSRVPGSVIIYCRSRDLCRDLAKYIESASHETVTYFHAGLTYKERELRQNRWMKGEYRIMVATNAFGMGIDKPDVRLVVHMTMPSSLEEYFQEAGRAGRDGERSYAVALISPIDEMLLKKRYRDAFPEVDYIMHTYEMLCNYLSVGEGEGLNSSYDFDLNDFVRVCHMRPAQTKPAIEIMALSGWLEYHEDDTRSRLMISYTRDELYAEHVGHDKLLRTLLRTYTGLFSDYVYINEGDIAKLSGYTHDEVYGMLTALSRKGVLHYIPKRNIPRIVFRIRREDTRYLRLTKAAYTERKERLRQRLEAVLSYVKNEERCRTRVLLDYFGEDSDVSCAKCDICLSKPKEGLRHHIVEDCRLMLLRARDEGRGYLEMKEILRVLSHHNEDLVAAVQYLSVEDLADDIRLEGDLIVFVHSGKRL